MKRKSEFKNRLYGQFVKLPAACVGVLLLCLVATSGRAQTYSILGSFTGDYPSGGLVLSGATLYGATGGGAEVGITTVYGTLFKIGTDGNGFTTLRIFSRTDGEGPRGDLVVSGMTLYGTTIFAGASGDGEVFKINTNGSGFTVLKSFAYTDGYEPNAPLALSGTTLYGTTTTYSGGYGTVFRINTDGSGFQVLKYFSGGVDGKWPYTGLTLSGTTLYGTTSSGGSYTNGTVFKIATDGSGFTVIKHFTGGSDGSAPEAPLVVSGSTLYGTTFRGGSSDAGTIFKVNTDGSGYTVLKQFAGGLNPGALVLSGATLYGTTGRGGNSNCGTIFMVSTDGSGYRILKEFTGKDGNGPMGSLLSGRMLYGVTRSGGPLGYGVVFSLSIAPPTIQTPPQSQTAEIGSPVDFTPDIAGCLPVTCQLFFNGACLMCCGADGCLTLTNADFSMSGTYTVVVTNIFGAVTSAPAMLNVIPAVARRPVPRINLMGDAGSILNLVYADSLTPAPNWTALDSVSLTGTSELYFDLTKPLPPHRFYRVWQTGTPSVAPSLTLPAMIPAITLTGNIGDKLRVDCINQYGPTDAWVTLDTITLTNTSQLYFDVSAPGQPARLYRIVPVP